MNSSAQQLQQAIEDAVQHAESQASLTRIVAALPSEEKQSLLISSSSSVHHLADVLIPDYTEVESINFEQSYDEVGEDELHDPTAVDSSNNNIHMSGNQPNIEGAVADDAMHGDTDHTSHACNIPFEYDHAIPPSSHRSFYTHLLHWRLKNDISRTSFEQLLVLLKNQLIFQSYSTTAPSHSTSYSSSSSHSSSDMFSTLDHSFSTVSRLPTSEYKLFSMLGLQSKETDLPQYAYVQCPQAACGQLYRRSNITIMQRDQTVAGHIDHHKAVFCNQCKSPLYFTHLPAPSNRDDLTSSSNITTSVAHSFGKRPRIQRNDKLVHYIPRQTHIPAHPLLLPYVMNLTEWLTTKSKDKRWWKSLDRWKTDVSSSSSILGDICHGSFWNEPKHQPFLHPEDPTMPSGIALSIHADGFQQNSKGLKSIYTIYLTINNLPREDRFTSENALLYALVPGVGEKQCSEAQLHNVLRFLVAELQSLQKGFLFRQADVEPDVKQGTRSVFLFDCVCDAPALRKICGFGGLTGDYGCIFCTEKMGRHAHENPFYTQTNTAAKSILSNIQGQIDREKYQQITATSTSLQNKLSENPFVPQQMKDVLTAGLDAATYCHVKVQWVGSVIRHASFTLINCYANASSI